MRLLHTADWHLGRTLEGRSRFDEQVKFIDELVAIVRQEEIDVVLIAGDVFDSVNPPADAEQLFYEAAARLCDNGRRKVVAIAGNHDHPARLAAAAPLAANQSIHLIGNPNADLLHLKVARTNEMLQIYPLPYPSESRMQQIWSNVLDENQMQLAYADKVKQLLQQTSAQFTRDAVHVIMSHLFVLGGLESDSERPIQVGGAYTLHSDCFSNLAQYVALGHLHRPQMIRGGETSIRYSGSPIAYSFSESGQTKSVTIVDLQAGGTPVLTELPLSCGKPLVRWKAVGGMEEVLDWIEQGKDQHAWIDLEINLQTSLSIEQIHQLRKLHGGIVHIRPHYLNEWSEFVGNEHEVNNNYSIDELFVRFYQQQTGGAEPEPELIQLFLELVSERELQVV